MKIFPVKIGELAKCSNVIKSHAVVKFFFMNNGTTGHL